MEQANDSIHFLVNNDFKVKKDNNRIELNMLGIQSGKVEDAGFDGEDGTNFQKPMTEYAET